MIEKPQRPGNHRLTLTGAGLFMATLASSALAGNSAGSITFSPSSAAAIPTLGNALLLLLAGLLALIALKSYRHSRGVTPMIAGLLTVAALASTGGGINLLRQAQAGDAFFITNSGGETLPLFDAFNQFQNDSGTALGVTDIQLNAQCSEVANNSEDPECAIGETLDQGDLCVINVECTFDASDRRLKTDISHVGVADNGLPIYRFRYKDGAQYYEGVMAQDVLAFMPEAVLLREDGFYAVSYDMLNMRMRRVE